MSNKFDLEALKASWFIGAARTHVEKAYLILTGEPEESIKGRDLEELRVTCQRLTNLDQIRQSAPVPAPEPKTAPVGRIPNLGPSGKWEGRMRRVQILNPDKNSAKKTVSLAWEGRPWDVLYDTVVDMPWPYWAQLKDAVYRDDRSENAVEWNVDKKGRLTGRTVTPIETPVHNYVDLGDVPGTEDLPESYFDFFKRRAAATDCFRDLRIPMLLLIYERLYDGPPVDRRYNPVQLDAITLRLRIAERLGPEFVTQLNTEMFDAA